MFIALFNWVTRRYFYAVAIPLPKPTTIVPGKLQVTPNEISVTAESSNGPIQVLLSGETIGAIAAISSSQHSKTQESTLPGSRFEIVRDNKLPKGIVAIRDISTGKVVGMGCRISLGKKSYLLTAGHVLTKLKSGVRLAIVGNVQTTGSEIFVSWKVRFAAAHYDLDLVALEVPDPAWATIGVSIIRCAPGRGSGVRAYSYLGDVLYVSSGVVRRSDISPWSLDHSASTPDAGGASGTPLLSSMGAVVGIHLGAKDGVWNRATSVSILVALRKVPSLAPPEILKSQEAGEGGDGNPSPTDGEGKPIRMRKSEWDHLQRNLAHKHTAQMAAYEEEHDPDPSGEGFYGWEELEYAEETMYYSSTNRFAALGIEDVTSMVTKKSRQWADMVDDYESGLWNTRGEGATESSKMVRRVEQAHALSESQPDVPTKQATIGSPVTVIRKQECLIEAPPVSEERKDRDEVEYFAKAKETLPVEPVRKPLPKPPVKILDALRPQETTADLNEPSPAPPQVVSRAEAPAQPKFSQRELEFIQLVLASGSSIILAGTTGSMVTKSTQESASKSVADQPSHSPALSVGLSPKQRKQLRKKLKSSGSGNGQNAGQPQNGHPLHSKPEGTGASLPPKT
jgi:hypothetical protein